MVTNTEDKKITTYDKIFDDIRPCRDDEVESELNKIISDEMIISSILKFRFPVIYKKLGFILKPFVKILLKKKISQIKTIKDFKDYLKKNDNKIFFKYYGKDFGEIYCK